MTHVWQVSGDLAAPWAETRCCDRRFLDRFAGWASP
jgi:hypothetical protein